MFESKLLALLCSISYNTLLSKLCHYVSLPIHKIYIREDVQHFVKFGESVPRAKEIFKLNLRA
jgi:hypothetical protein